MEPEDTKPWALGCESWTFHRWFFQVVGRPAELGEYSHLKRQLWRKPEVVVAGVFRLTMRDGSPILVLARVGADAVLYGVLPTDWQIGQRIPWRCDPDHVQQLPSRMRTAPLRVARAALEGLPSPGEVGEEIHSRTGVGASANRDTRTITRTIEMF